MTMQKFADHIIAIANDENIIVTNLHLQKVMYFTLKKGIEQKKISDDDIHYIYDEKFKVWAYGPVVLSQYNRFKRFSASPIIGDFNHDKKLNFLNDLIIENLKTNVFKLVEESHRVKFWKDNESNIKGFRSEIEYDLGDL